ncbi:MAG: LytTR family DNA-binding domain-containing protein [Pseudomonadota bacterium]
MPSAIIADDEDLPRSELRRMLGQLWPELTIVAECEHGEQALEAITQHAPDVAFLDIRMPGLSGIDVAQAVLGGGRRCHTVFVTAYDQHAVAAFDAGAFDYLLKPVAAERLQQAVSRLKERLAQPAGGPDVGAMMSELDRRLRQDPEKARIRWISASAGDTIKMLAVEKVLFFESDGKYTRVVTADDEAHVRKPLKELMDGLDPELFWQIHRGLVVRADAIRRLRRDEMGRVSAEIHGSDAVLKVSQAYAWRFRPM